MAGSNPHTWPVPAGFAFIWGGLGSHGQFILLKINIRFEGFSKEFNVLV